MILDDRQTDRGQLLCFSSLSEFLYILAHQTEGPIQTGLLKLTFSFSHLVFQQINCSVTSYKLGN